MNNTVEDVDLEKQIVSEYKRKQANPGLRSAIIWLCLGLDLVVLDL